MSISIRKLFKGLYKLCQCECGTLIPCVSKYNKFLKFKHGHQNRGQYNPKWNKGIRYDEDGYIRIYKLNHPNSIRNYVREHRLVYEHYLSIMMDEQIYIPKDYHIHHINGIKDDNRLINLELLTHSEHIRLEMTKDKSCRFCSDCSSTETYIDKKTGYEAWYEDGLGGLWCKKCYTRRYRKKIKVYTYGA